MLRLFLALSLPQETKDYLVKNTLDLKRDLSGKWVASNNMHVTLQFLGDVQRDRVDELGDRISEITKTKESFDIALGDLGAFPSLKNARVLWVGLSIGQQEVSDLVMSLRGTLSSFLKGEDRFHPHVTLARFREPVSIGSKVVRSFESGNIHVPEIVLYQSKLESSGPKYIEIEKFAFNSQNLVK